MSTVETTRISKSTTIVEARAALDAGALEFIGQDGSAFQGKAALLAWLKSHRQDLTSITPLLVEGVIDANEFGAVIAAQQALTVEREETLKKAAAKRGGSDRSAPLSVTFGEAGCFSMRGGRTRRYGRGMPLTVTLHEAVGVCEALPAILELAREKMGEFREVERLQGKDKTAVFNATKALNDAKKEAESDPSKAGAVALAQQKLDAAKAKGEERKYDQPLCGEIKISREDEFQSDFAILERLAPLVAGIVDDGAIVEGQVVEVEAAPRIN